MKVIQISITCIKLPHELELSQKFELSENLVAASKIFIPKLLLLTKHVTRKGHD